MNHVYCVHAALKLLIFSKQYNYTREQNCLLYTENLKTTDELKSQMLRKHRIQDSVQAVNYKVYSVYCAE
jgi:hypothetical protein